MERGSARSSGWVVVGGNPAEDVLGEPPCLVCRDLAVSRDHAPLVGGFSAAVTGAVVDDEGFRAGGMDADTEVGEPVVPGDPGLSVGSRASTVRLVTWYGTSGFVVRGSWSWAIFDLASSMSQKKRQYKVKTRKEKWGGSRREVPSRRNEEIPQHTVIITMDLAWFGSS